MGVSAAQRRTRRPSPARLPPARAPPRPHPPPPSAHFPVSTPRGRWRGCHSLRLPPSAARISYQPSFRTFQAPSFQTPGRWREGPQLRLQPPGSPGECPARRAPQPRAPAACSTGSFLSASPLPALKRGLRPRWGRCCPLTPCCLRGCPTPLMFPPPPAPASFSSSLPLAVDSLLQE